MNFRLSSTIGLAAALLCSTAMAQSDTLSKIKASGSIQIGGRDSQIPFSYKPTGSGDPVGFTNDICLKIVDAIKAKLGLPNLEVSTPSSPPPTASRCCRTAPSTWTARPPPTPCSGSSRWPSPPATS